MSEREEKSISTTLRLTKALGLARRGKLREAQHVVAPAGSPPEDGRELHALAALVTGEGDYLRGLQLWQLLLQREPGHAEARRMVAAIELWLGRPAWYGVIPWAALAVFLFVVSLFIFSGGSPAPAVRAVNADTPVVAPRVAPAPQPVVLPKFHVPESSRRRQTR